MGNGAQFLSLTLSAAVSCSVLTVVWFAHVGIRSGGRGRSLLRVDALAALAILSGCEFYFFVTTAMPPLAHAAISVVLAAFVWAMFARPASRLSEGDGEHAPRGAGGSEERDRVAQWPEVFLALFYAIFGRRVVTRRFFGASAGVAFLSAAVCAATMDAPGERVEIMLSIFPWCLVPAFIVLLKTRAVIRLMSRRPSTGRSLVLVAADVSLTLVMLAAVTWASSNLFSTHGSSLRGVVRFLLQEAFSLSPRHGTAGPEWALFVVAGLTSIWIWLYAASHVLTRAVARFPRLSQRLDVLAPDMSSPLPRLGAVAVVIVLAALFGLAPFLRMSVGTGRF